MSPVLDDLLNDGRLARLFSTEARDCALQPQVQAQSSELGPEQERRRSGLVMAKTATCSKLASYG
jgi:hypothetical protein